MEKKIISLLIKIPSAEFKIHRYIKQQTEQFELQSQICLKKIEIPTVVSLKAGKQNTMKTNFYIHSQCQ